MDNIANYADLMLLTSPDFMKATFDLDHSSLTEFLRIAEPSRFRLNVHKLFKSMQLHRPDDYEFIKREIPAIFDLLSVTPISQESHLPCFLCTETDLLSISTHLRKYHELTATGLSEYAASFKEDYESRYSVNILEILSKYRKCKKCSKDVLKYSLPSHLTNHYLHTKVKCYLCNKRLMPTAYKTHQRRIHRSNN